MAGEWPILTVEQLVKEEILYPPMDGNHGEIHPKGDDFVPSGIPFIMSSDLKDGRVDTTDCKFITEIQARNLRKGFAKEGDVLLSHKATIGRTAIVDKLETEFIMLTPQVTYYRVRNASKLDNRFLKYYFDSHDFQQLFSMWAEAGSTRAYLGITAQLKLPIEVPPVDNQRAIAHILGTLDDKIELNRKTNQTLEAIARAIFKSWFVDFDPVRAKAEGRDPGLPADLTALFPDNFEDSELGEIPKGWRVSTLEEVIAIHDSKRIPLSSRERQKRRGKYPYYGAASVMDYVNDYLFDGVYVLVGEDGSVINDDDTPVVQYAWGKFWVNNHAHVLTGKNNVTAEHLLLFLKQLNIRSFVTGAVQPKLNQGNLCRIPFILPPDTLCGAFSRIIEPTYASIRANIDESHALTALRDAMLPKLLSGELRVNIVISDKT